MKSFVLTLFCLYSIGSFTQTEMVKVDGYHIVEIEKDLVLKTFLFSYHSSALYPTDKEFDYFFTVKEDNEIIVDNLNKIPDDIRKGSYWMTDFYEFPPYSHEERKHIPSDITVSKFPIKDYITYYTLRGDTTNLYNILHIRGEAVKLTSEKDLLYFRKKWQLGVNINIHEHSHFNLKNIYMFHYVNPSTYDEFPKAFDPYLCVVDASSIEFNRRTEMEDSACDVERSCYKVKEINYLPHGAYFIKVEKEGKIYSIISNRANEDIHKSYILNKGLKMIKKGNLFSGRLHPLVQPYKNKFNCDVVVLYYDDRLLFRVDDTKELYICDELQGLFIQENEIIK